MIQQKSKPEMFAKPGAPLQGEMLTIQVKNTMLRLNGQNLKLAAKNGRNSKTPGLHLSATRGRTEALGQLTAPSPTQEGTALSVSSGIKSARPDAEKRRPLKLAPLDLPDEVWEAQREKLKLVQEEPQASPSKLETRRPKPRPVKAAAVAAASPEPLKTQLDIKSCRPQLTRCSNVEQIADKNLEEVVCRGTSAPLCSKPAPPSLTPKVKAATAAACVREAVHQNAGILQQEAGRGRRLRLRRVQRLEEDQCNSNASTAGLSADGGKLAQGGRGRGRREAAGAQKGQPQAGRRVKEPLVSEDAKKKHPEDGSLQSAGRTLTQQADGSGSGECGNAGTKPNACNLGLKRRKPLITRHNDAVPPQRLQM